MSIRFFRQINSFQALKVYLLHLDVPNYDHYSRTFENTDTFSIQACLFAGIVSFLFPFLVDTRKISQPAFLRRSNAKKSLPSFLYACMHAYGRLFHACMHACMHAKVVQKVDLSLAKILKSANVVGQKTTTDIFGHFARYLYCSSNYVRICFVKIHDYQ